jgi:hypothetical protein
MRWSGTLKLHFTPFFSAAEETVASAEEAWTNEGGHMHARGGHIVQTPQSAKPYKVLFDHEDGTDTEQACTTMRECEALIRRRTPTPPLGTRPVTRRRAPYDGKDSHFHLLG